MDIVYILLIILVVIYIFTNEKKRGCVITPTCKNFFLNWIKYKIDCMYYCLAVRNNTGDCDKKYTSLKELQIELFNNFNQIYGSANGLLFNKLMSDRFAIKLNLTLAIKDNNKEASNMYEKELDNNSLQLHELFKEIKDHITKDVKEDKLLTKGSIFARVIELASTPEAYIANILESASLII
jgi:hypothetical protein